MLPDGVKTEKNKLQIFEELEQKFTKNNAVLAYNYIINLESRELSYKENKEIIIKFFEEQIFQKNNFVDISFHIKNQGKEDENLHCHVLEARRTINKEGEVGNALRLNTLEERKLDDIKWIRKELVSRINEKLKEKNSQVRYTDLNNDEIVKVALEKENFELALEKNYTPIRNNNEKFKYSKRFINFKNLNKRKREEAKQKAEDYKKNVDELEKLEKEQEKLKADLKELLDYQEELKEERQNKIEIYEYLSKNKYKIASLKNNIDKYNEDKKQHAKIFKLLITNYHLSLKNEKKFNSQKDLKEFFEDVLKENKEELNEDNIYKINLLAFKISQSPENFEPKFKAEKEENENKNNNLNELKEELKEQNEKVREEKQVMGMVNEILAEHDKNINKIYKMLNTNTLLNTASKIEAEQKISSYKKYSY